MDDEAVMDAVRRLYDSPRLESHLAAAKVYSYAHQSSLGTPSVAAVNRTEVAVDPGIPTLAWLSELREDVHRVVVGSGVTVGPGFIVEGVWDGKAERGRFDRSELLYGSGVRLLPRPVFVPPRHGYEALWVLHDAGELVTWVSNSLTFVLTRAGLAHDRAFLSSLRSVLVDSTRAAARAGADRYDSLVHADQGVTLRRMMFHNFLADSQGHVRVAPLPARALYSTFAEYRAFLAGSMKAVAANGATQTRATVLRPITSVSSGYDSPAVASLAVELGFRDALTFDVTLRGHHDSGAEVGRLLGMEVIETPYPLGTDLTTIKASSGDFHDDAMAEFLATDGIGDNWVMRPWEQHLVGRLLFTGDIGDSAWGRTSRKQAGLPITVVYGFSLTEFRLRVGFAYVPVPAMGLRFARPLRALNQSVEMSPWTLGTSYDRPVARRLCEEAGLPRGSFAVTKSATNPHMIDGEGYFGDSVVAVSRRYSTAPEGVRAMAEQAFAVPEEQRVMTPRTPARRWFNVPVPRRSRA